jgi:hypothetical protein
MDLLKLFKEIIVVFQGIVRNPLIHSWDKIESYWILKKAIPVITVVL